MGIAVASFFAVFVLLVSGGLLIFYRETIQQRIAAVLYPKPKQRSIQGTLQDTRQMLGDVVEHFERVLPRSEAEVGVTQKRLTRAGYRTETALKLFYGAKVLAPLILCLVVLVSGIGRHTNVFFLYIAALGLGFLAPDFWLGRQITQRQNNIRRGLPDALDMLVICVEAGLSLDQAVARTSEELRRSQPAISDELSIVSLEQRAGRPRGEAWKHLAERTDVDSVRNLVSMLIQSEQFGTSIAKTLRVQSDTLRTKRIQQIEEKAAKLSIKLLFPLVLFIFPSLFVVVLGPAIIIMSEAFKNLFNH
jgi:tight adherence protein C